MRPTQFNEPLYKEDFGTKHIPRPSNIKLRVNLDIKKSCYCEHMLPVPRPFVISRFHCKIHFGFPQTSTRSSFSKVPIINGPGKQLNTVLKGGGGERYCRLFTGYGPVDRLTGSQNTKVRGGYDRYRVRFIIVMSPLCYIKRVLL